MNEKNVTAHMETGTKKLAHFFLFFPYQWPKKAVKN
jgi:hypothetical protein